MLLNRQRVKFWQRIIFGFMAVLMAGFLIFGYSGVMQSCNGTNALNSGNSTLDKQVKAAVATLAKTPNDPTALLGAAQGYQAAGNVQSGLPASSSSPTTSPRRWATTIATSSCPMRPSARRPSGCASRPSRPKPRSTPSWSTTRARSPPTRR